jgi:hypothetical protein
MNIRLILFGLAASTALCAVPGTTCAQANVRNDTDHDRILFGGFVAKDQSFTGLIPFGWQVQVANLQHFLLTSLQNEKVWVDVWEVPMDAQSLARMSQADPLANAGQIYSPPLAPIDVLKQLYPRFAQGTVQNLSVLPKSNTVSAPSGVQAGVFDYRYLYQGQFPYEGEMLITTLPPTHLPLVNYWNIITLGGEGPAEFFRKNKALYVCVLDHLKYNQPVLNQAAREPFDRMWENDPEYNKRMDDLITSLGQGDEHTFEEPNGARHTIYGPLPGPEEKYWWCGGNIYRIGRRSYKPDVGCGPLQQVVH